MEGYQHCTFVPTELQAAQAATWQIAMASRDGWHLQSFGSSVENTTEKFWAVFIWRKKVCKKHGSPLVPSGANGKPICLDCI
jgi:hypothetical protein